LLIFSFFFFNFILGNLTLDPYNGMGSYRSFFPNINELAINSYQNNFLNSVISIFNSATWWKNANYIKFSLLYFFALKTFTIFLLTIKFGLLNVFVLLIFKLQVLLLFILFPTYICYFFNEFFKIDKLDISWFPR
jgi:hypothetical protein